MTKQQSLSKICKDLMLKEPYYGFFLIMLNKLWDDKRVPTAGVSKNGINYQLCINETFWMSLSEEHRLGLLKHELLHIAFGHLTTYFKYSDKRLANIAMDMEINQYIDRTWLPGAELSADGFNALKTAVQLELEYAKENNATLEELKAIADKLPPRGVMLEDYADLNLDIKAGANYYYDKLREAKDKKDQTGTSGDSNFDALCDQMDQGDNDGMPDHSTWEDFENLTEAEQKLIEKQLQKVLSDAKDQTIKKRGTIPGEIDGVIKLDEITAAKFDWRGYIRRFTGVSSKVYTKKIRRKENRRFSDNPGLKIKMKQHMLLAIDTSGSVSNDELTEFMSEIHHIYKAGVDITIIQCDTSIRSIESYKGKNELEVHGRGGTQFDPVLEYYNEHQREFTSLVYFTDGECDASVRPKGNVLWVISERSEMNNDLPGKVIKLEL
jgi:predicted metal-dependent peptidase